MATKLTDADWEMYESFGNWAWYCWACGVERGKLDNAHIVGGQGREHDRRAVVRLCRDCHQDHHASRLSTANLCWLKHNFDLAFYDVDYLATLMIKRGLAGQRHSLPQQYRDTFQLERGMDHVRAGASLRREWADRVAMLPPSSDE